MEVTVSTSASPVKSALAAPHAQASVSVSLHPLVLVNISDHWTRTRAQNNGQSKQGKYHFHETSKYHFFTLMFVNENEKFSFMTVTFIVNGV